MGKGMEDQVKGIKHQRNRTKCMWEENKLRRSRSAGQK